MLKPIDVLTSSGKYPAREADPECTQLVRDNAFRLASRVSALFGELGIDMPPVSSGFRTSAVNSAVKNAAKRSSHMTGEAVDLEDPNGLLAPKLTASQHLLEKYDLYMENPQYTKTWVHLQTRPTKNRIFIP